MGKRFLNVVLRCDVAHILKCFLKCEENNVADYLYRYFHYLIFLFNGMCELWKSEIVFVNYFNCSSIKSC